VAWVYLVIAGLFEIGWAISMKYTDGFTKLWPSILTIALMIVSFSLLSTAYQKIEVGTAYAVWTGIGAAGTAILGMMLFGESANTARLVCLGAVVAGVVGLKLTAG
jgi:quaternary ammonium compound-resistance protein SugE